MRLMFDTDIYIYIYIYIYIKAEKSRAYELMQLFYVVFRLARDGQKFDLE